MQPPFHRSPLDGYAVRTADIAGATQEKPVVLRVVDKLLAGDKAAVPVEKGQAVRLMTGCMIPEGADYVVRQEDTDLGQSFVRVYVSGIAYGNYCCRGEEYQIGDLMLPAGLKLDAAALSVAAGAGFSALSVVRKVKAAILSIGNELQDSGTTLQVAKIYDANAAYLSSRLKQMGVEITSIHLLGDDCTEITETLLRCMEEVDIILSTGGVSVGEMDLVEQAVLETGAEILFHGIDIKPGMPTLLGLKNNTFLLALSGNPFAAAVPFELLIHPILAAMTGDDTLNLRYDIVQTANGFYKTSPTRRFLRGKVENGLLQISGSQSNGQMRSMVGCNCLVDIPGGTHRVLPGEMIHIIRI